MDSCTQASLVYMSVTIHDYIVVITPINKYPYNTIYLYCHTLLHGYHNLNIKVIIVVIMQTLLYFNQPFGNHVIYCSTQRNNLINYVIFVFIIIWVYVNNCILCRV